MALQLNLVNTNTGDVVDIEFFDNYSPFPIEDMNLKFASQGSPLRWKMADEFDEYYVMNSLTGI